MTRGRRKAAQKRSRTLLSVIRFLPVLAYVRSSPFRPSPIFRRPLFMCFSATVSRQRRELPTRQWASLPFLSPSPRSFCPRTFESQSKGGGEHARIKCQIFWKCKQVESPSVSISRRGSVIFFRLFRDSKVSWS